MTITLTSATRIAGAVQAAGTQYTLDPALEADLVRRNVATYVAAPALGGADPVRIVQITAAQLTTYTGRTGEVVEVTDLPGRPQYRWDGAQFVQNVGSQVIAMSGAPVAVTGTVAETTVAQVTVPALGPNDGVEVFAHFTYTGSANAKTMKFKLNDTVFGQASEGGSASNTQSIVYPNFVNKGVTNAQAGSAFGLNGSASTSGTPMDTTIQTNVPTTLKLTAQLANTGETITLRKLIVKVLRSPS